MKRSLVLLPLVIASVLTGCLKEDLRSSTTAETYFRSSAQVETGLNGCYVPLRGIFSARGYWLTTDVDTDVMYIANSSTMYEANCDISPARPGIAATVWSNGYLGVMRTNEIISDIRSSVSNGFISDEESEPFIAEAMVLRTLYYYLLTATFGDVPYYTEKVTEGNRSSIASLPRMSADATRDSCIRDMKYWILAKKVLPMRRTYDVGYRAGAAVGLMLGAKCAAWNKEWSEVLSFVDALEDIYGKYSDSPERFAASYPLTDIPFSQKYVPESIFECGNAVISFGIQTSGLIASIATPKRSLAPTLASEAEEGGDLSEETTEEGGEEDDAGTEAASDYYDGIVIPELGAFARTSTSVRPTEYFYQQLESYFSQDLRGGEYSASSSSVPRGGSGNLAWRWRGYEASDVDRQNEKVLYFFFGGSKRGSYNSRPWLGNKFWCPGMYNSKDSNNYKIFRFADALLLKAEAFLGLGKYDAACDYLNITRVRANMDRVTFAGVNGNPEALMEEIRRERARELFGEFQRKYDLVRWGIWYERTRAYNTNRFLQDYIRPCHEYWPIPQDQVSYSGNALDNAAYAY